MIFSIAVSSVSSATSQDEQFCLCITNSSRLHENHASKFRPQAGTFLFVSAAANDRAVGTKLLYVGLSAPLGPLELSPPFPRRPDLFSEKQAAIAVDCFIAPQTWANLGGVGFSLTKLNFRQTLLVQVYKQETGIPQIQLYNMPEG